MKTLISIVGTTGIGKTKLAIDLARHFKTEIISCDSRQFFSEMKIGTAAPTQQELLEAPHHFVGNLSVKEAYSIGQFEIDALKKLDELFQNHDFVIMVGGSMMYEKAVIEGLHNLPEADPENQDKLHKIWEEKGILFLQQLLKEADPEYFEMVDQENPRRLFRALDIIWQTGKKYSEIISKPKEKRGFRVVRIGIEAPREIIYEKINQRVLGMMESGLTDEVKKLTDYRNHVALKTVGYTEIFNVLDGKWTLDFAVSEIQKNSRRFAKRQLTWYRNEENIRWVNYQNSFEESLSLLSTLNLKF